MQGKEQRNNLTIDYGTSEEYFAIRIMSEDMKNAHFQVGALVVVRKQRHASNGDIVLVLHNGKICFRYYAKDENGIYLTAANNEILPVMVKATDDFIILGKAKEIRMEI